MKDFILFLLLAISHDSSGFYLIEGTIHKHQGWRSKGFIAKQVSLLGRVLVDSFELDDNGKFEYHLKGDSLHNEIYLLYTLKDGDYKIADYDGMEKNSMYIAPLNGGKVCIESNINSFFYSYESWPKKNKLDRLLHGQRIIIDTFVSINGGDKDAVKRISSEIRKYRQKLSDYLLKSTDDREILIGMTELYYASFGSFDSTALYILSRINDKSLPIFLLISESISRNVLSGTKLPSTTFFFDSSGNNIDLLKNNNRIKVLYFWASWCPPCRQANRTYNHLVVNKLNENSIFFAGVSIDKNVNSWKEAVKKDKPSGVQLIKPYDVSQHPAIDISGVPVYLILSEDNVVLESTTSHEYVISYLGIK